MTILVCDDDKEIVDAIEIYLIQEGYQVVKAYDGEQALDMLRTKKIDLMVIDVMMPKLDGIRATFQARKTSSIPIIILSAKTEDADKILGLNVGADDYVTKPFSPKEVMARIHAVMKRGKPSRELSGQVYDFEGLHIDMAGRSVTVDGEKADLTPKEYELLFYFVQNNGVALTRERLLNKVWGYDFYGDDRTVDTHVKMLRGNLKDYRKFIVTLRGLGYKFEA